MYDAVALGELLIDFSVEGVSDNGNALFERNPGGAPANVLTQISRLGLKTSFIGKVGKDQFGIFLKEVLEKEGVGTEGLILTHEANTTLAFVHLDEKGDRSFSFYRNPGADMMLNTQDLSEDLIKSSTVFHFGTVSMTHEPSRSATLTAAKIAWKNNSIISFDPNIRPPLWKNLEEAKRITVSCLDICNILKISEDELKFLTGYDSLERGTEHLFGVYGIPLILVTLGPGGCCYRLGNITGCLGTYDVKTIDTTGAGDSFLGSFLFQLIDRKCEISKLSRKELEEMIDFANAAGSLATTRKGAIPAMPVMEEILHCMRNKKRMPPGRIT